MKTKPEYWYEQSAIIPYRIINNKIEILIITSRKKKHWIIPKGIIENNLSPLESAQKEALEEAGVIGNGNENIIGKYKYKKWGGKCKVTVFSMEVKSYLDIWTEDFRERKWIGYEDIDKYINNKKLLKIINNFFKLQKKIVEPKG